MLFMAKGRRRGSTALREWLVYSRRWFEPRGDPQVVVQTLEALLGGVMRPIVAENLVLWNSIIRNAPAEQADHATRGKPGNLRRTGTFAAFSWLCYLLPILRCVACRNRP